MRYKLDSFEIELPLSHELPFYRAAFPEYDANLGRLAAAVGQKYPGDAIVDIGANVGDTAAIIRSNCSAPLLCIEGSEPFSRLLERNAARLGPNVFTARAFVGNPASSQGTIVSSGKGTARLVPSTSGRSIELTRLSDILARFPALPPVRLVKIDTDGFDWPILEDSLDVWERAHPVLFVEFDPALYPASWDPLPALERLARLGYGSAMVYDNTGEYVISVSLEDRAALEDVHQYYSGRNSARYADLCLFHSADRDLWQGLRRAEIARSLSRR
ncbi:FkbM family methyltransferase [Anaeromyxobacter sp. SG17]|uniref:FkbM family methyltransferase n=1 Tax=Anaeromyxobacter sp. SG17 TaxID=2925405 RepID=UPI001F573DAE|nr:FkbM family methyltransferase [Anaeromyxobacter sp. SG17]